MGYSLYVLAALLAAAPQGARPKDASAPAPGRQAARSRIAVLDVTAGQGISPGTAATLTAIVVADVGAAGLDASSTREVATLLGFEDVACIAEIAGALGVDLIVAGQVALIGSRYHLALQIIDPRKARVAARASRFVERSDDALVRGAREVVASALADIGVKMPVAPAPPPQAARRHKPAWIAFGVAGALLAGGGTTGLVARGRYRDLEARQGTAGYAAEWEREAPGIRRMTVAADALLVGGVVAAGVGTWLWFRADSPVALVPTASLDGAGLALAGAF
jgi:hypothetical protein